MPSRRDLLRCAVVGVAVTTALGAGALAWSSTLLGEYSVMDMGGGHSGAGDHGHDGHAEHGAGGAGASAASGTGGATGEVDVTSLTADPDRPADVRVELVARQGTIDVPGGRAVEGYTVNGTSPGPEIRARQGDLVEVEFVNESVAAGATLHWHGIDVPNAADGVAGITQDAVPVGGRHVYRFEATDAGTYWYHSHQVSHEQVLRGLLGAIVIDPAEPACHLGRRGRDGAAARLRRPAHAERAGRGRARGRRARLDRAGARHQLRPGHRSRLVGGAVPGARDRRARSERPDRGRGPQAAHPGRRASGCRRAGAVPRSRRTARRRRPQHRSSATPRHPHRRHRSPRRRSTCSPTATPLRSDSTRRRPTARSTT